MNFIKYPLFVFSPLRWGLVHFDSHLFANCLLWAGLYIFHYSSSLPGVIKHSVFPCILPGPPGQAVTILTSQGSATSKGQAHIIYTLHLCVYDDDFPTDDSSLFLKAICMLNILQKFPHQSWSRDSFLKIQVKRVYKPAPCFSLLCQDSNQHISSSPVGH